jgi:hypothetical protein
MNAKFKFENKGFSGRGEGRRLYLVFSWGIAKTLGYVEGGKGVWRWETFGAGATRSKEAFATRTLAAEELERIVKAGS